MTRDNKGRQNRSNRRTVLKSTAGLAATMGLVGGPTIGLTAASSEKNVVISIQRGKGNGIDANKYNKLLSRFIRAAKKKAELEELAVAKPELSAGEKIYSLTFVATPDGNAQTYIGSGTNPGDTELKHLHDRSIQFQEQNTVKSTENGLSTQQTEPDYEWDPVGSAVWEKSDDPYGIVQNSSEAWHYADDPNYDVFAATTDAAFEPGSRAYDSDYFWDTASVRHYWGRNYEPGDATLTDWAPNGDRTGDTAVSTKVSYSGAAIGVSYNPPEVQRTDNTGLANDNVRLKWEPGDTDTKEDIFSSSVASVMKSGNYASVGDNLAETSCRYTVSRLGGTKTLSTPLTLQYES